MSRLHLLIIIILSINGNIFACSCIGTRSFCESTLWNKNIAIVEVISTNEAGFSNSFDVQIENVLSGTIEEDKISINYHYTTCTDVIRVDVGDKLIINFNTLENDSEAPFPTIDFSICSVNFLLIQNGNVIGEINSSEIEQIPFNLFLENFGNCTSLMDIEFEDSLFKHLFSIKPNPTLNTLFLKIPGFIDEEVKIDVFNNLGQRLYSTSSIDNVEKVIDLHHIPRGVYNCVFRFRSLAISKKFVKI